MSGTFSDYQVHQWLEGVTPCWVALHFDSPTSAGAYASEFSGEGYTRAQAQFSNPVNRTVWCTHVVRFSGLAAGVISWVAGWDALTGGNLLWAYQLDEPVRVVKGGGYAVAAGDLALSFG